MGIFAEGKRVLFKQDFETAGTPQNAGWLSPNLTGGMSIVSSEHGSWFEFSLGGNNNRNAFMNWKPDEGTIFDGLDIKEYTVNFLWGFSKNSSSPLNPKNTEYVNEITILSGSWDQYANSHYVNNGLYATKESLRLFSVTQLKGAYINDNPFWVDNEDNTNYINDFYIDGDTENRITLTEGEWYDITLRVDVEKRTTAWSIYTKDGILVKQGNGTIAEDCNPYAKGINVLLGRYNAIANIDNVKVSVPTEGDYANEPCIDLTEINMAKRTYMISFEEGETLHVKGTNGVETTTTTSPYKYVTEISGVLEAWTVCGTFLSGHVTIDVDASVMELPSAQFELTKIGSGYDKTYKMTVDNSIVPTQPTITLTYKYNGGGDESCELPSGSSINLTEKGVLEVTTHAKGFGSSTVTINNDVEYVLDNVIDFQHMDETTLIEKGFVEKESLQSMTMSGENNWTARERLWYGIADGGIDNDGNPTYDKHTVYGYYAEPIRRFFLKPSELTEDVANTIFAPVKTWYTGGEWDSSVADGSDVPGVKFYYGLGLLQSGILGDDGFSTNTSTNSITYQNAKISVNGLSDNDYYMVYTINDYGSSSLHPLFPKGTVVEDATLQYKAMNLGDALSPMNLTPERNGVSLLRGTEDFALYRIDTAIARIEVFKSKSSSAPIEQLVYSVIGNFNGESWSIDHDMTKGSNGLYTLSVNSVSKGNYEFKVRVNHDWEESYGSNPNGDNCQVSVEDDNSKVVITFNSETNEIAWTVSGPLPDGTMEALEICAFNADNALGLDSENGTALISETVIGETASIVAKIGADDIYKPLPVTFTINGQEITGGLQGRTNPKDADGGVPAISLVQPASGAFLVFEAKADGFLYVMHRTLSNKAYTVFEEGTAISYTLAAIGDASTDLGAVYQFTLPYEVENEQFVVKNSIGYAEQEFLKITAPDKYNAHMSKNEGSMDVWNSIGVNGLGVIKFPVYKDCKYVVNANGSKIIATGFAFSTTDNVVIKSGNILIMGTDDNPINQNVFSVIGNFNDDNWSADHDMTKGSNGLYTVSVTGVSKGSYEFKVRVNHDWEESYGSNPSGDNCQLLVEDDNSTVVITFNSMTHEIAWSISDGKKVVAAKDWTGTDDLPYIAFDLSEGTGDYFGTADKNPDGIAFTINEKADHSEPLISMVLNEFDLEKGTNYRVVAVAKFPCDGQLQIDLGNWASSMRNNVSVTATGDFQEITCDFLDYNSNSTSAFVQFYCGDFLGTTILKSIKVVNLDADESDLIVGDTFTANTVEGVEMTFKVISAINKTCQVSSGNWTDTAISCSTTGSVTIPSEVNGYQVVAIGDIAFLYCSDITSVTIPNSITSIGYRAFEGCSQIKSITIPASVVNIDNYAFGSNASLRIFVVDEANPEFCSINGMLMNKSGNKLISFPSGIEGEYTIPPYITSVNSGAFGGSSLTKLTFPATVTSVGAFVATSCNNLQSLVWNASCNKIPDAGFRYCNNLSEIKLPEGLEIIGGEAFIDAAITEIVIPSTVTTIESMAFHGCNGLTSVTIPQRVTSIGYNTFSNCSYLTDVYCLAETVPTTESNAFNNSNIENATLHVPTGCADAYNVEPWSNFGTIVEMELTPMENKEEVDFGESGNLSESTDLSGTIIDKVYFNIAPENGGYNADENCVVLSKSMTNEEIETVFGKDLLSDEVKTNFAGMVIEVSPGKGKITVDAQTTGGMTLMVKIGSADPVEMEFEGKMKMNVPYNVDVPTYVYIYAGDASAASRRIHGVRGSEKPSLKIYGISVSTDSYLKGDANNDGKVNAADIVEAVNAMNGHQSANYNAANADMDGNSNVDQADIDAIVKIILQQE